MKLESILNQILIEDFIRDNETVWLWVTPNNELVRVPKLRHKDFIMRKYKDHKFAYDYDKVFDQALKDGWVRVIYEYFPERFKGDLSVNGYHKSRVIEVVKYLFGDLLKYGHKSVYVDYENPSESHSFTTFDMEGKRALNRFLNEIT